MNEHRVIDVAHPEVSVVLAGDACGVGRSASYKAASDLCSIGREDAYGVARTKVAAYSEDSDRQDALASRLHRLRRAAVQDERPARS